MIRKLGGFVARNGLKQPESNSQKRVGSFWFSDTVVHVCCTAWPCKVVYPMEHQWQQACLECDIKPLHWTQTSLNNHHVKPLRLYLDTNSFVCLLYSVMYFMTLFPQFFGTLWIFLSCSQGSRLVFQLIFAALNMFFRESLKNLFRVAKISWKTTLWKTRHDP